MASIVGIVSEGDLLRRAETGTEPRPSRWLELVTSASRLAADYTRTHGRKAAEVMTRDVVTSPTPRRSPRSRNCWRQGASSACRSCATAGWSAIVSRRNLLQALRQRGCRRRPSRPMTGRSARPSMRNCVARPGPAAPARSMPWSPMAWCTFGASHRMQERRQAMVVAAENIPGVRAVRGPHGPPACHRSAGPPELAEPGATVALRAPP